MSPIPPQFLKGKAAQKSDPIPSGPMKGKLPNDEATETVKNPQEDAQEVGGSFPSGHSAPTAHKGKKAHPNAKKAMLLASLKKG